MMPFYLSQYIGSGTLQNPCRAVGSDVPGAQVIDLRKDGGASADGGGFNRCLLYSPQPLADGRLVQFGSERGENLGAGIRAILAATLGISISFTRLDDLIAELLLRPPANAWKPITSLEIHLGGLAPVLADIPQAIGYAETWSTADSGSLTSSLTWTEYSGTGWAIVSNKANSNGNNFNEARAEHATRGDAHTVSATLSTFTYSSGSCYGFLIARKDTTATRTHYHISASRDASPFNGYTLDKVVSGTTTNLGFTTSTTPASSHSMSISTLGSSIRAVANGVTLGPITDSAVSGNTYGGIGYFGDTVGNTVEFDNWGITDLYPEVAWMRA